MQRRTLLTRAALGATLLGNAPWAAAQSSATSSILVGATPGGAADIVGRLFAQQLERQRQAPFVVENRAGAVGTLGVVAAIKARPDGRTIALGSTGPIAISPALMKNPPYDPLRDLTHAALLATTPNVLVVPANGNVRGFADLRTALAGGRLNYGSSGNGTTQHLAGVLFNQLLGQQAQHVPFRGPAESAVALAAGHVDFGFLAFPASLALVREGRLRAIGVTSLQPMAAAPEITGLSGFDARLAPLHKTDVWFDLAVAAATPADTVASLNASVASILGSAEVRNRLSELGYQAAAPTAVAEVTRFVGEQVAFWNELVRSSEATVD